MVVQTNAYCYYQSSFRALLMRTRCLQRPNRGEEDCTSSSARKHKVPQSYSRAGECARSLTAFGMTVSRIGSSRDAETML
jgi:hypothetical protein